MPEKSSLAPPPRNELPWVLEAMLFASGDEPQTASAMARAAGVGEQTVRRALDQLQADYRARGLRLQHAHGAFRIVTSAQYSKYVARLLGREDGSKLSRAALETLSIIAYRQPCTRGDVEAVRGVNSDRVVAALEQRGVIEEAGRSDRPGRPKLYRPTLLFYEHFGYTGREDLPPLPEEPVAEEVDPF
jgi:segregation and condensation protein B